MPGKQNGNKEQRHRKAKGDLIISNHYFLHRFLKGPEFRETDVDREMHEKQKHKKLGIGSWLCQGTTTGNAARNRASDVERRSET